MFSVICQNEVKLAVSFPILAESHELPEGKTYAHSSVRTSPASETMPGPHRFSPRDGGAAQKISVRIHLAQQPCQHPPPSTRDGTAPRLRHSIPLAATQSRHGAAYLRI